MLSKFLCQCINDPCPPPLFMICELEPDRHYFLDNRYGFGPNIFSTLTVSWLPCDICEAIGFNHMDVIMCRGKSLTLSLLSNHVVDVMCDGRNPLISHGIDFVIHNKFNFLYKSFVHPVANPEMCNHNIISTQTCFNINL